MHTNPHTAPILLIGGNGKTGSKVAQKLAGKRIPTRIVSRSTEIPFDWHTPDTWASALEGTSAAYITFQPDLAVPGAVETIEAFASIALSLGVKRLTLLSGRGEEEAQRAEQALQNSGADWTIVRASWFAQNFSESFLKGAIMEGQVTVPVHIATEPFIDTEDIADVVVAALTDPAHIGKLYEVTGPKLLSFEEAVGEIASATGKNINYQQVPLDQYAEAAATSGVPEELVSLIMFLFSTVLDGRNQNICNGVEQALGRPATDFTSYAQRAALSGAWGV